jgi:hypothetical protein
MTTPITWTELQHGQQGARRLTVEVAYRKVVALGNIEDRIRIEHLGWVFDAEKGRAVRPSRGWSRTALVPNKYPYWTAKGIHHWLLWSDRPLTAASVNAILGWEFGGDEVIWFVNQPELRSVPGLWHAHVFWRV